MALPSLPPDPRLGPGPLLPAFVSFSWDPPHLPDCLPICFSPFSKSCGDEGKTGFLSCNLPRLLDHFGPVGPRAKLLKTAVVNPWSKPRWAEMKDGLSRNGVISSLESNVGCCQVPSQPSGDCLLSASGFFCCFVSVFVFRFVFVFLIRLSLGTRSLHQRAFCILDLPERPFCTDVFICVCLGLP